MSEEAIRTRIWREEAEPDNPFATRAAYCHGYDVYGEMLGRASWADMVYLMFRGEAPTDRQEALLEGLAVALANPGPRDASVHAAMCGGTCGSPIAAGLMAALAVGAGKLSGAREVFVAMARWQQCGTDLALWRESFDCPPVEAVSTWPELEHPPGFDPHGGTTPTPVVQCLSYLADVAGDGPLSWLAANRRELETAARHPLALSGVAAAAFTDLGFAPDEGEALYLLLRLPGAAVHALEQGRYGHKKFPFFELDAEMEEDAR